MKDIYTLIQFSLSDLAYIWASLEHHRQIYTMAPPTAENLLELRRIETLLLHINATAKAVIAATKKVTNES